MSEEAIRQFEEEHGSNHNATRDVQHVLRLKDLGVKRLLDFGCGFGQFLEMCHLFGIEAVGVDRSNARRSGAGVQVFAELNEVEGKFDAITMFEVLEHLDDALLMLRKLRARLRSPNGVVIVPGAYTSGYQILTPVKVKAKSTRWIISTPLLPKRSWESEKSGFTALPVLPYVTTSLNRIAKDIAKAKLRANTTQHYFRTTWIIWGR
jgi:2-polyprenyl-3-methyl-5-hydroxy-6-metoxy-1,4-benzoquinol methylase